METRKRIVIAGATGFIGRALVENFTCRGYEICVLTRSPIPQTVFADNDAVHAVRWDAENPGDWCVWLEDVKAIINLCGENIAKGLWTKERKEKILNSRVNSTRALVRAACQCKHKPEVFLQASATGYYGDTGEECVDETSAAGESFLAGVCKDWEAAAAPLKNTDVRLAIVRISAVLGKDGGMLKRLLPAFRFFLGGKVLGAENWISWIHIEDLIGLFCFLLESQEQAGPFNAASPEAVRAGDFYSLLGRKLHRPVWPIPKFVFSFLLGDFAREVILCSQNVSPKRLRQTDFVFRRSNLEKALNDILK